VQATKQSRDLTRCAQPKVQAMEKQGYVYIMTNERHTVLYVGVTSDLPQRHGQHKTGQGSAFTRKYNAHKLVYVEEFPTVPEAIQAEKRIKGGSRSKKVKLITGQNPEWKNLAEETLWWSCD
jgi:putative endonuclease